MQNAKELTALAKAARQGYEMADHQSGDELGQVIALEDKARAARIAEGLETAPDPNAWRPAAVAAGIEMLKKAQAERANCRPGTEKHYDRQVKAAASHLLSLTK
mgnify:CR=1 FL=1